MKYMRQFGIIMLVTCVGEIMKYLIPLSIPSSIYGLCLMMILLVTGVVKLESVKETGTFLIQIMPLMFIPAAVGILASWSQLQAMLVPLIVITIVSTVLVMIVSGRVTQILMRRDKKNESDRN